MARGKSGRIVIEVDPILKHRLYVAVTEEGKTLKDWFLACATEYLRDRRQLRLPFAPPEGSQYSADAG